MDRKKKAGTTSLGVIAIFLAIVIVLNIFATLLPENITQLDISASRLYSVSANTKAIVSGIDDEINIYWICQSGEENSILEKLLAKYDALSDLITVSEKDPDVYPTFAQQYTNGSVSNNDIVVEGNGRYRYISQSDIFETENTDYYTGSYDYYFDGEGEITSAIDYVTKEDLPKLYRLTGHNEAELPTKVSSQLAKENIELVDFSLLTVDEIPEDCDGVIIYSPESDISEPELDILNDYINNGGKIIAFVGPVPDEKLENFHKIIGQFDITSSEGIVIESDGNYYAFNMPYVLLPDVAEDVVTSELLEADDYILVPLAEGLNVGSSNNGATVTELLTTADTAISKAAGYSMDTYEFEDGDQEGSFALALKIEVGDGVIYWMSSGAMLDETYNSYSSGANLDFSVNCISEMVGETDSISIRSKSLNYEYLSISDSDAKYLKIVMIAVVPMVFVIFGIIETIQRRKLR